MITTVFHINVNHTICPDPVLVPELFGWSYSYMRAWVGALLQWCCCMVRGAASIFSLMSDRRLDATWNTHITKQVLTGHG